MIVMGNVIRALIVCLFVCLFVCIYKRLVRAETHLDPDGSRLKPKLGEWLTMRNGETAQYFEERVKVIKCLHLEYKPLDKLSYI